MKSVYPMVIAVSTCICMTIFLPRISLAQCACAGGTVVTQVVPVDTNTAPTVLITFNKFANTALQALSCITITDTMSVVSSTGVLNTITSPQTGVTFVPNVNYTVKGPGGVLGSNTSVVTHGPYNLGPSGSPTDYLLLGPDTLFNKAVDHNNPTNPAPYTGTGTVSDTVAFGGGTTTINGNNFTFTEQSKYWGTFVITYYTCPPVVLATSITNFTAIQNGSIILLQWLTNNEQNNSNYEIQVSSDGNQFSSAGQAENDPASAGSTSKYQYQYNTDQINVGKLYFRIKQTDASGKVSYSTILVVNPGGSGDASISYQTYPNPATNTLVFQFSNNQTGRYLLELINTAGQSVQQKSVTLAGANHIRLDLSPQPAKGLYFMRVKDLTHNQNYVSKVLIN
jgi:hypothetical protein